MDFKQDMLTSRRRFRTLSFLDTVTRECLGIEVDTSLSGKRIVQVLDRLVEQCGTPKWITLDSGPEFHGAGAGRMGVRARGGTGLHRPGQVDAERIPGELRGGSARRLPESALVPGSGECTVNYRRMGGGVRHESAARCVGRSATGGVYSRCMAGSLTKFLGTLRVAGYNARHTRSPPCNQPCEQRIDTERSYKSGSLASLYVVSEH